MTVSAPSLEEVTSDVADYLAAEIGQLDLTELAKLRAQVFELLQAARPEQAWNALCLLWQRYIAIHDRLLSCLGAGECHLGAESVQSAWQAAHSMCKQLASASQQLPPYQLSASRLALIQAQLAYHDAQVRLRHRPPQLAAYALSRGGQQIIELR
jgi:hypothetical protein